MCLGIYRRRIVLRVLRVFRVFRVLRVFLVRGRERRLRRLRFRVERLRLRVERFRVERRRLRVERFRVERFRVERTEYLALDFALILLHIATNFLSILVETFDRFFLPDLARMNFRSAFDIVDVLGRFIVDLRDFFEDRRLVRLEDRRLVLLVRRVDRRDFLETRPRFEYIALRALDMRLYSLTERRMMVARVARLILREPSLDLTYRRMPELILESLATRPTLVDFEVEVRVDRVVRADRVDRRRRRTVPYRERLDTAILRNFYFYTLYNIKNFGSGF